MNTFLPYASFLKSVKCLDNLRLGKQRVEAKWIIDVLENKKKSNNHPCILMWKGYLNALKDYYNCCLEEWHHRGYNNIKLTKLPIVGEIEYPPWLNDSNFIMSQRSNLLRKDPTWYGKFNWNIPDYLPYIWPKGKSVF